MDPVLAIAELGGAARAEAILALGVSWPALRSAAAVGLVAKRAPGTYALPRADRGVVAAAALRGRLTCVSACAWWGLKSVSAPDSIHVGVPTDRGLDRARLARFGLRGVHRGHACDGSPVVPVEVALDHAARCTRPIEHLVLVDSALKLGRLDPMAVGALCTRDARRQRWLAAVASRVADSPPESVARAVLHAAGFHPRAQEHHDRVGHIDLGVGYRHGVEIDGFEPHSSREAFAEDRRRDREMAAQRKWSLRFTYWDVMRDPRAFGLEVSRITGYAVDARFDSRMAWLMAMPKGHLNRRASWRP